MTQFVNDFEKKRRIEPKYKSFDSEHRSHSSSFTEKKPISISKFDVK